MTNEAKIAFDINSYTSSIKLSSVDIFNKYSNTVNDLKKDLFDTKISYITIVKSAILNKMDIDDYLRKIKKAHKIKDEFNQFISKKKI
ncbi:hypothetical protein ACWTV9_18990 [Clostridioides difficile]